MKRSCREGDCIPHQRRHKACDAAFGAASAVEERVDWDIVEKTLILSECLIGQSYPLSFKFNVRQACCVLLHQISNAPIFISHYKIVKHYLKYLKIYEKLGN